jgi:hypothetical protein
MARYVAFQLAAYPPRNVADDGPVRRSSVREGHASALSSHELTVRLRETPAKGEPLVTANAVAYGFGWGVFQTCDFDFFVGHNGATDGFAANVALLPEYGIGTVALTNYGDADLGPVSGRVLALLKARAGLSKRALDLKLAESFAPAMKRFLAVYNQWDDASYDAMLAKGRPRLPAEKGELTGYKNLHGTCTGYSPIELTSPLHGRFAMQCERGKLEMEIRLNGDDRLIMGFSGTSRDVPPPANVERVARDLAGLIKRWDEAIYKKRLLPKLKTPRAEVEALFTRVRADHGGCAVKTFTRRPDRDEFSLTCDRGGDLRLSFTIDEKDENVVASLGVRPLPAGGMCPVATK